VRPGAEAPRGYAVGMTTRTTRHCRRRETCETKMLGKAAIRPEHDGGHVPSQLFQLFHDSGRGPGSRRWGGDVAVERFAGPPETRALL
jgi:hypothetical protein